MTLQIKEIPWTITSHQGTLNISRCWQSNWLTKQITAQVDHRQAIQSSRPYKIPDFETRLLMAKLILEEALETISALGVAIVEDLDQRIIDISKLRLVSNQAATFPGLDIYEIIDGACDLIYVATGVLTGMNVPDLPHLDHVCLKNEEKFPNNKVITNPDTGKYLKPKGWTGPRHDAIQDFCMKLVYTPNMHGNL